jgi:hypothetical protein
MCTCVSGLSGLQVTETEVMLTYLKGNLTRVQVEVWVSQEQVESGSSGFYIATSYV